MKKYSNLYLIFIIFLLFCTGCNNNQQFMNLGTIKEPEKLEVTKYKNGAILIEGESSGTKKEKDPNFNLNNIKFGPDEINFGAGEKN